MLRPPMARDSLAAFGIPAAIGVLLFVVLTATGGSDGADTPPGFYLEALVVVDESARTIGTNVAGAGAAAGAPREHHETLVRWWYRDPHHVRIEYETPGPLPEAGQRFVYVRNGDRLWSYDAGENSYTRLEAEALVPEAPAGSMVILPSFSILLGWAPGGQDQLLSMLEEIATGNGGSVTLTGREELLGRIVTVIETTHATASQVNGGPIESDGVARYYFDEASGFILANEADSEVVSYRAEVTRLDEDTVIPLSRFSFTPPPGSTEVVGEQD